MSVLIPLLINNRVTPEDIVKFSKDFVLGDFEEQPSNAAMIVGGLVSLIPIADQVMDVRDVSGMIYRINKKTPKHCTPDDWVDLALAAFGCIPEVGSFIKTLVKPLWKGRKALAGALRGSAFIEQMLGRQKGNAITFVKTFNWAGYAQVATQTAMTTMDTCDQFLAELAKPAWWNTKELNGLATDLRPGLQTSRGAIRNGVQEGATALRAFVTELIGEDALRVVQAANGAAVPMGRGRGGRGGRSGGAAPAPAPAPRDRGPAPSPGPSPAPPARPQTQHPPTATSPTVDRAPGAGPMANLSRSTRGLLEEIGKAYKAVIGEHMADYHHMGKVSGVWPHGHVLGKHDGARWGSTPRLVTGTGSEATPMELVPEHIIRSQQNGVDGIWSLGGGTYHFVEAKFSESAGAMFGLGADGWRSRKGEEAPVVVRKPQGGLRRTATHRTEGTVRDLKLVPPTGFTERQIALWCMLGQPQKGLQMGVDWLTASVTVNEMKSVRNFLNRFVYVFFAIPSASPPAHYTPLPGGPLRKGAAPGILEHIAASTEVAQRAALGGDVYDLALHAQHQPTHGISDSFTYQEIDSVDEVFVREYRKLRATPSARPDDGKAPPSPPPPAPPSTDRGPTPPRRRR